MAATVAGTFEDRAAAQVAVERLRDAGIPVSDISLIVRDVETPDMTRERQAGVRGGAAAAPAVDQGRPDVEPVLTTRAADDAAEETADDYSATATGTATGGLIGALGGLLIALQALALPGLGPIIAAGPLAAALGGAAIGAATGGLVGALVDAGVPENYATTYSSAVERGHALLTVRTDAASAARVRDILVSAGALDVYPSTTTLV